MFFLDNKGCFALYKSFSRIRDAKITGELWVQILRLQLLSQQNSKKLYWIVKLASEHLTFSVDKTRLFGKKCLHQPFLLLKKVCLKIQVVKNRPAFLLSGNVPWSTEPKPVWCTIRSLKGAEATSCVKEKMGHARTALGLYTHHFCDFLFKFCKKRKKNRRSKLFSCWIVPWSSSTS